MKNIFYILFVSILIGCVGGQVAWTQPASEIPEWMVAFEEDYDEHGMSMAVENALEDGVTPNEILTFIISYTEKFRTKRGLKALYCAGVDRNTVRDSANKLGITVENVSVSLEEAIAECGSKMTLEDRDLMDEPASSPETGASALVQSNTEEETQEEIQEEVQEEVQTDVSVLIDDPTPSSQPSSPSNP
ncbi:MAG: hypothetical protein D3916_04115 [Candidatus Electrothrix sp. MAN1_4]|nr:hypothetical protein [Candidatus Electrothrix sp. MAN1_4]